MFAIRFRSSFNGAAIFVAKDRYGKLAWNNEKPEEAATFRDIAGLLQAVRTSADYVSFETTGSIAIVRLIEVPPAKPTYVVEDVVS